MSVCAAPALYEARTVHVRRKPFVRRFSYRLFQLYLDVDAVAQTAGALRLFSHNRANLFSFHDRDHGPRDGSPLRPWAEQAFAEAGVALEGGALRLLCFPRVLGYVFNPLSLFFGHGPDGRLRGVIYEVANTFGERHVYVAPTLGEGEQRQAATKRFHVSPFFDVAGEYRFRLEPPGERFALGVTNLVAGEVEHFASLAGRRRPLTDARLAAAFAAMPFMTLQVIAGIHWQALGLWLRGAQYRRKPMPREPAFTLADPTPALPLSSSSTRL